MTAVARTEPAETKLVICVQNRFSLWNPPAEMSEKIRADWPGMRVVQAPGYQDLEREIADADILIGHRLSPQQLEMARKLRWMHSVAAGVTHLMYPEMRQSGIVVTNASSVHSVPIAQHLVGTLIALARRFPDCFRFQQQALWASQQLWDAPVPPRELLGQVIVFVGFGAIGRATAKLLSGFEMRIHAVTRSGRGDLRLAEKILPVSKLHEALPEADFVVLAVPETAETHQMFGPREFELMKPTAYFVNVARGALVDEAGLVAAIESRAIAGAALDVTAEEPLPPASPLWKLPNVFITPHVSGATDRAWKRQGELIGENLGRWFSGQELLNRVDLDRGY
jgi:D-2-hydroxyacid dehydrogenase (NADP+)